MALVGRHLRMSTTLPLFSFQVLALLLLVTSCPTNFFHRVNIGPVSTRFPSGSNQVQFKTTLTYFHAYIGGQANLKSLVMWCHALFFWGHGVSDMVIVDDMVIAVPFVQLARASIAQSVIFEEAITLSQRHRYALLPWRWIHAASRRLSKANT